MKPYSFELPEMFVELCIDKDIKGAMKLVEECFDMFPKEKESITFCILDGLMEGAKDELDKVFFKYLLKHLEILHSNYGSK